MIGHLLNETLTVYRPGYVDDGRGGRTRSLTAVGTIRAKVDQPAPSIKEHTIAARMGAVLSHVVHTTYGADVARGDELEGDGGPRRLRVVECVHDSRRTYTRLACQAIQGE